TDEPDAFQQKWTQIFLDSGVDIVVGTHPHTLQPFELRTGSNGHRMLVYYSIGNYISAQPEKSCVKGGIAQFTISLTPQGYQLAAYDLQPLEIVWHQGGKYTAEPRYDS
ncbi:MAG: CapA family protein, partial [Lachnospiraceae bacterium]|nr:CapA family protein [Lachnospiraceae bacterium]